MHRTLIIVLAGIALIVLVAVFFGADRVLPESTEPSVAPQAEAPVHAVQLFYYDPARDTDAQGNIMCSRDGLSAVTREVTGAQPLRATLDLLLRGELTAAERAEGITTEFPLAGVSIVSVALDAHSGEARITLADPQRKLVGGSCRTAVLAAQLSETALQFPGVTSVTFLPEDVFQP